MEAPVSLRNLNSKASAARFSAVRFAQDEPIPSEISSWLAQGSKFLVLLALRTQILPSPKLAQIVSLGR